MRWVFQIFGDLSRVESVSVVSWTIAIPIATGIPNRGPIDLKSDALATRPIYSAFSRLKSSVKWIVSLSGKSEEIGEALIWSFWIEPISNNHERFEIFSGANDWRSTQVIWSLLKSYGLFLFNAYQSWATSSSLQDIPKSNLLDCRTAFYGMYGVFPLHSWFFFFFFFFFF